MTIEWLDSTTTKAKHTNISCENVGYFPCLLVMWFRAGHWALLCGLSRTPVCDPGLFP